MKVIAVGDIANHFLMDDLPEVGIVIEATRDELRKIAGNILYRDVEVNPIERLANLEEVLKASQEMRDTLLAIRESHSKLETGHDVLVVRTIDRALAVGKTGGGK